MCNQCIFPGCTRGAAKDSDYCVNHRKVYDEKPKVKKKPKPIPKRSAKMKQEMKLYKPQVKAYLAKPEKQLQSTIRSVGVIISGMRNSLSLVVVPVMVISRLILIGLFRMVI